MKKKKIEKNESIVLIKYVAIIMIILIIVAVVIGCKIYKLNKQSQNSKVNISNQIDEKISNTTSTDYQLNLLKAGTERDRIEYYCGQFFKYIENQNYTKAYEILYPEFKQKYFPTIEEFTKYTQKTYPSTLAIQYDDIDRQGNIYITTITIQDAFAKADENKKITQRIVVQENDYNQYVVSFQVI